MKDLLSDVLRQFSPFDKIRIMGNETGTRVESYTEDIMLYLYADLKTVVPEFAGEFGLGSLPTLKRLLEHTPYKHDDAKLKVRRVSRPKRDDGDCDEYVAELVFYDSTGGHTSFKTINPLMLAKRAQINPAVRWSISVTPSKAKITEVIELTTVLSQVEQYCSVAYSDRNLSLIIGSKGPERHHGSVVLASDVDCGPLSNKIIYQAPYLLTMLKNAGNLPCTISFAEQGLVRIVVETKLGVYDYILRGKES